MSEATMDKTSGETTKKTTNEVSETQDLEEIKYKSKYSTDLNYTHKLVWQRVLVHVVITLGMIIGFYFFFFAKWQTILWGTIIAIGGGQGVALGAHRGFSHKSFKMKTPLRVMLIFLQTVAGQNSVFTWTRDHKLHHKYSDTDADPHNSTRGFFFSHVGWLLVEKNPLLLKKTKEIDVRDLTSDPYIMFQYKYFLHIYFVFGFLIPVIVPIYFWQETFWTSVFVAYFLQYGVTLHMTWCINSFSHLWGNRPYDKRLQAVQSTFTWFVTIGDGWHNFHHAFPWDSRLSEYGQRGGLSTMMLDTLTYLGLAYDAKIVPRKMVNNYMKKHGDKTYDHTTFRPDDEKIKIHKTNE